MKKCIILDPSTNKIKGIVSLIDSEKYFKALSHPLRIKILKMLSEQVMYSQQIAEELNISQQLANYHIKVLKETGLVEEAKRVRLRRRMARLIKLSSEGFAILLKTREEHTEAIEKLPRFLVEILGREEKITLVLSNPEPHGRFMCRGKDHYMIIETVFKLGIISNRYDILNVKLDTEVTKEDLSSSNVILLGNPMVNMITYKINDILPIKFSIESGNNIVSTLSGKVYTEEVNGVIELISNPYNENLDLLLIAGKSTCGTIASIIALNRYPNKIADGNRYDNSVIAHVVEGVDLNCDNAIDEVNILE